MTQLKQIKSQSSAAIGNLRQVKNKLRLATAKETRIVNKSDILYLKSDSNYCEVHFTDGTNLYCSQTLKSIYDRMDLSGFYRPHASYVINVDHIIAVNSSYDQLTLDSGKKIPISRTNKKFFKARMEAWFD